jgi:hypothetical protein
VMASSRSVGRSVAASMSLASIRATV